jgi:hypothetical protein
MSDGLMIHTEHGDQSPIWNTESNDLLITALTPTRLF